MINHNLDGLRLVTGDVTSTGLSMFGEMRTYRHGERSDHAISRQKPLGYFLLPQTLFSFVTVVSENLVSTVFFRVGPSAI